MPRPRKCRKVCCLPDNDGFVPVRGGGAQMALSDVGIRLYGGVSGNADAAAEALTAGELDFNPNVRCDHHDHHGEGHSCGSHGCGHHSCD